MPVGAGGGGVSMADSVNARPPRLGLMHMAATGAAVLLFLFVLLWATSASGGLPYLREYFGPSGSGSPMAIALGAVIMLVLGGILGLITAMFFNVFRFLAAVESVERG
jgi:hypothetical protein